MGQAADDMELLEEKVRLLGLYYPEVDSGFFRELLVSCNGSVERVKGLIAGDGRAGRGGSGRGGNAGAAERGHKRALYQSSIASAFSMKRIKPSVHQKVVHLHTGEEVEACLAPYVSFHRNFLPAELADSLLRTLMKRKHELSHKEFYIFDNFCRSSHSSGFFVSKEQAVDAGTYGTLHYNGESLGKRRFFHSELQSAADATKGFINGSLMVKSKRLPFQHKGPWIPNTCAINYFETLSSHLDMHSDRLNDIGPHNYIGSLSLGSTREFRMRKVYGSSTHIYSIDLPHNTLLVMHPGCQEEYKHGVNAQLKTKEVNEICGVSRFNLTFRHYSQDFIDAAPKCKCEKRMLLRRSHKTVESRGTYFWSCENVYQKKECGVFHWANFANKENNFVAESEADASFWIADEDDEKLTWLAENAKQGIT